MEERVRDDLTAGQLLEAQSAIQSHRALVALEADQAHPRPVQCTGLVIDRSHQLGADPPPAMPGEQSDAGEAVSPGSAILLQMYSARPSEERRNSCAIIALSSRFPRRIVTSL